MYGELISSVTVGAGGASSIDFTSIPGTYTDLVLAISARTNIANISGNLYLQINGVTTNQTTRRLTGNGSSANSSSASEITVKVAGANATANVFGNAIMYIPNYANSANKSISVDMVGENNASYAVQEITANLWSSTAAITALSFQGFGDTILQNSIISLYGLTKGSGGATVS